ncbi:hypothetical protein EVG20_g9604 [Dentipellis fragilis]|uniref:Uncharacterized protein n=1 Tax=Dentipellis fragilis TaxID=205917 RepID=A0A4Y9XX84_9AGAM|nr:hypothetical protein EVG20_g9604 [Dentipellis fragilis]
MRDEPLQTYAGDSLLVSRTYTAATDIFTAPKFRPSRDRTARGMCFLVKPSITCMYIDDPQQTVTACRIHVWMIKERIASTIARRQRNNDATNWATDSIFASVAGPISPCSHTRVPGAERPCSEVGDEAVDVSAKQEDKPFGNNVAPNLTQAIHLPSQCADPLAAVTAAAKPKCRALYARS